MTELESKLLILARERAQSVLRDRATMAKLVQEGWGSPGDALALIYLQGAADTATALAKRGWRPPK